eukprot:gene17627-23204_t
MARRLIGNFSCHGFCGFEGICTCYDNWGLGLGHYSGDCSQRICPYEIAWVDTPDKLGDHHSYAECSARGICNRDTGECDCFPGYEGKACARTTCPNDCSGHGRCLYIEDLPYDAVPLNYREGYFLEQYPYTFSYYGWDNKKSRGCYCDPGYGELDCSKRLCPYGTDVMDQRSDLEVAVKHQVQEIIFDPFYNIKNLTSKSFALTFKSRLNETFTTIPIVLPQYTTTYNTKYHSLALNIKSALEALPNQVVDKVTVAANVANFYLYVNITFSGDSVQGPQNLLTVRAYECGDGCTPKIDGLNLLPKNQNVTQVQVSDYSSYECGRRGKCDYTTGICSCFSGYTGVNCNVITSLV